MNVVAGVNMMSILPGTVLLITALLVLVADLVWSNKQGLGVLALVGVVAAGLLAVLNMPAAAGAVPSFQGMAVADRFALVVTLVIAVSASLALLISLNYVGRVELPAGEFYGLLLLSATGMVFLAGATHLLTIFLSLEILSIALYALAGLRLETPRSGEAALKYFLLGAFASAFLLYGMALVYGSTGSTSLAGIAAATPVQGPWDPMLLAGLGLMLVGFAFKIAAVPFHMWTPDVYQGAPSAVTAFMSVGAKAAGFAALLRLLVTAFPNLAGVWVWPVAILAVLTMTWGNLAALAQNNVKRMLAYSSIAHAGYLLVGVAAGGAGVSGVLFYLMAYALMNVGAFAVLIALERAEDTAGVTLDQVQGLFTRRPWLAAAMTVFMLSLAGIPPLAGFFGKLYVFSAAVQQGLLALAIFGVINSVISAYYYLRVVGRMALAGPAEDVAAVRCVALDVGTALAAVGTVLLGLYPTLLTGMVQGPLARLFGG